ncbi:hypothetical protein, partial [Burkholderia ubonensis]|uniref:hypothetical protein n=1 Tax=Burkholderia ubonensis TaxID=101571 RepID=UPI001E43F5EC
SANRSSLLAGSKLNFGDVMIYVILNNFPISLATDTRLSIGCRYQLERERCRLHPDDVTKLHDFHPAEHEATRRPLPPGRPFQPG